ncbi:helix-turn-helix domain-containing protein [Leptothrix discophora]|uniref:Helix-turn-helix domain-containing protein n=1 Tax=Leptothrix discophora TaxID=89 RepID=A0ABT9G1M9_LEPDI|nr:helix-turn-helix domain-containing protein [Leptothrix discophora]MDP4300366.1 helix-turn-helix domain-containing protein [Leptothrix discophora]
MNQTKFADAIGVSPQHVTNWKKRGMPADWHVAVAHALGRSVDELLGNATSNTETEARRANVLPRPITPTDIVTTLADLLDSLPEASRAEAEGRLLTLARAPDSQRARQALTELLEAAPAPASDAASSAGNRRVA